MPERALLRLKRGGISLYNIQKMQKTVILFEVEKKDVRKVFAIYPNVCYNSSEHFAYKVTPQGGVGLAKWVEFCKKRTGIVLGLLAFACVTLAADNLVLGIDVVGATAYARESKIALADEGIKPFAFYAKGREAAVTAKLLQIEGAEFCSVKKIGNRVRVELRVSPLHTDRLQRESMLAKESGRLLSLTVLRGTALKKAGDEVKSGEPLVGNYILVGEEKMTVEPIARARVACVYEGIHTAATREQAFAEGYLAVNPTASTTVTAVEVTEVEEGFHVKISYEAVQTINL